MKKLLLFFSIVLTASIISCDDEITVAEDPAVQKAEDITIIDNYLDNAGYTTFGVDSLLVEDAYTTYIRDTTENGVRYVVLKEGDSTEIDESDIVYFDYIGYMTNDTIFDTSIREVADSVARAFEENLIIEGEDTLKAFENRTVFQPQVITYSQSGWSINGFILGYSEGIAASFHQARVGDRIILAIPSGLAYGPIPRGTSVVDIPANSVLIFELFPVFVRKQ